MIQEKFVFGKLPPGPSWSIWKTSSPPVPLTFTSMVFDVLASLQSIVAPSSRSLISPPVSTNSVTVTSFIRSSETNTVSLLLS
jgi:hypothetical protein